MIKFENKINGRFYYLSVEMDLLNDCVLRINFGGVGVSRYRVVCVGNMKSITQEIEKISKKRLKRGYCIVN